MVVIVLYRWERGSYKCIILAATGKCYFNGLSLMVDDGMNLQEWGGGGGGGVCTPTPDPHMFHLSE